MRNFPDRLRYHYEEDKGANLRVAHGVWGGVNPHGQIEICFYEESDMPPRFAEMTLGADGAPGVEHAIYEDDARHMKRHIHTKLLLNYETAQAVAEWLQERLGELEGEGEVRMYDQDTGPRQ